MLGGNPSLFTRFDGDKRDFRSVSCGFEFNIDGLIFLSFFKFDLDVDRKARTLEGDLGGELGWGRCTIQIELMLFSGIETIVFRV